MTTLIIIIILIVIYFVIAGIKENEARETIERERKINNKKIANMKSDNESKKVFSKKTYEVFVRDEIMISSDPIRYQSGYPGETSRILTKNYYTIFFEGKKNIQAAMELLKYRNEAFGNLLGFKLDETFLNFITDPFHDKISILIFFICFHEAHFGNDEIYEIDLIEQILKTILEEHNKLCLSGQEEDFEINMNLIEDVIEKYDFIRAMSGGFHN